MHLDPNLMCPPQHGLMSDSQIIECTHMHGLPVFITTNGGYKKGCATVSVTIAAPDIREEDEGNEWEDQIGIILSI